MAVGGSEMMQEDRSSAPTHFHKGSLQTVWHALWVKFRDATLRLHHITHSLQYNSIQMHTLSPKERPGRYDRRKLLVK